MYVIFCDCFCFVLFCFLFLIMMEIKILPLKKSQLCAVPHCFIAASVCASFHADSDLLKIQDTYSITDFYTRSVAGPKYFFTTRPTLWNKLCTTFSTQTLLATFKSPPTICLTLSSFYFFSFYFVRYSDILTSL